MYFLKTGSVSFEDLSQCPTDLPTYAHKWIATTPTFFIFRQQQFVPWFVLSGLH